MTNNDNNSYQSMLSLCFEIEGLITLCMKRGGSTPSEIKELLKNKCSALSSFMPDEKVESDLDFNEGSGADVEVEESVPETGEAIAASALFEENEDASRDEDDSNCAVENIGQSNNCSKFIVSLTLNDKFRFTKTLFHNNDAEYAEAIELISSMHAMSDIEDYLYNDLCLDPQASEVKEFVEILAKCVEK